MKSLTKFPSQLQELLQDQNDTRFQFLLHAEVSNIFLVIDIIIAIPIFLLSYMMWCMIIRESRVRKGRFLNKHMLISYYVIVPTIVIFMDIYVNVLTRYNRVPEILSGGWFCGIFDLAVTYSMLFIGQFSFYTAVLRYWRIVYRPNASEFEERKFKKIIVILHLVIPALLSLLNAISNGKIDQ